MIYSFYLQHLINNNKIEINLLDSSSPVIISRETERWRVSTESRRRTEVTYDHVHEPKLFNQYHT